MRRPRHILRTRTILDRQHALRDHLTRIRANNMRAQNPVRLLLRQDLDEPFRVQVGLGARVGREAEFPDFVRYAFFLQVLFRFADPGDFRVCVDDGGDGVVVDVSVSGFDEVDSGDT